MMPILVSIAEAANMLSMGRTSIICLLAAGELEMVKFGRRTLITVDSITNAVAKRMAHKDMAA
jgi:excisionase family DNA binding protein